MSFGSIVFCESNKVAEKKIQNIEFDEMKVKKVDEKDVKC
jgi:hypothetical protein